jgi:hypothetical protein
MDEISAMILKSDIELHLMRFCGAQAADDWTQGNGD